MNAVKNIFFLFFLTSCSFQLFAQNDTCIYTLQLVDFFGDGWDGATLTAIIKDDTIEYTLPDSTNRFYEVKALKNERLQFFYKKGDYDDEVSYVVYDPDGVVIFSDGPFPKTGLILDFIACPSCGVPREITVNTDDNSALIHWQPLDEEVEYLIEYGLKGFSKDSSLTLSTRDTFIQISGLLEAMEYEFLLSTICVEQDTSVFQNRDSFKTRYAKDVGIAAITMPNSSCNLTNAEMINVRLKNFGGNPQTLIPFNFSVNGMDGGVMMPNDGFFTNILSKDSIAFLEFETTYDFSLMGVYEIAVWTALEGDSNAQNDTAYLQITSVPTIQNYPLSQDFERTTDGWTSEKEASSLQWKYGQSQNEPFNAAFSGKNAWFIDEQVASVENSLIYLTSPCFDFSNLIEEPKVAFRLLFNSPNEQDKLWVEMATNGEENWKRVEIDTAANLNWYNNVPQNAWIKEDSFRNWVYVENRLKEVAGQSNLRLRLVFESASSTEMSGGIAIDDFQIFSPQTANLVTLNTNKTAIDDCGAIEDFVMMEIYNTGQTTASNLEFYYQINNGSVIKETLDSLELTAGAIETYQFQTPFNSSLTGDYRIKSWVQLGEEELSISNTAIYQFTTFPPLPLPLIEDFEDGEVDEDWYDSEGIAEIYAPFDHNNASYILTANLWSSATKTAIHTANYGLIQEKDSLSFDYRFTLYIGGTEPLELDGDSLQIEISTDCGVTFTRLYSINNTNHIPTANFQKISIDLSPFIGQKAQFRFVGLWGHDDYWLDLDNIAVEGGVVVTSNNTPKIVENIRLFPNPSQSISQLEVSLRRNSTVNLEVLNAVGQVLSTQTYPKTNFINSAIDLSLFEDGIYFVKMNIDGVHFVRKLIKVN